MSDVQIIIAGYKRQKITCELQVIRMKTFVSWCTVQQKFHEVKNVYYPNYLGWLLNTSAVNIYTLELDKHIHIEPETLFGLMEKEMNVFDK